MYILSVSLLFNTTSFSQKCFRSSGVEKSRNEERQLFVYYKSYRANIRAKVNSLRARSAVNSTDKAKALAATEKYLRLMEDYLQTLNQL